MPTNNRFVFTTLALACALFCAACGAEAPAIEPEAEPVTSAPEPFATSSVLPSGAGAWFEGQCDGSGFRIGSPDLGACHNFDNWHALAAAACDAAQRARAPETCDPDPTKPCATIIRYALSVSGCTSGVDFAFGQGSVDGPPVDLECCPHGTTWLRPVGPVCQ